MLLKPVHFNQGFGRVVKHIVFWVFYYFGIMALNTPLPQIKFWEIASMNYWFLIADMLATYVTIYVFLPQYLKNRKIVLFIIQNIILLIFCVLLNRGLTLYIFVPLYYPEYIGKLDFLQFDFFMAIISIYFVVILAAAFKFAQYYYSEKQEKTSLEKQNLISELTLLRTQINPHFLFNTLNNIDSLIFSNPDKASELLIRLSDIMRYMLYDSSIDKVPLEKELHYLVNIIDLQSLRLKDKDFIKFTVEGDAGSLMISPMIFIPFVENAFKHCDKNRPSPGIEINIRIENSSVYLFSKNYIPEKEVTKDAVGGIGMYNVKRRLELIYPQKFSLEINKTNELFAVTLIIDLR